MASPLTAPMSSSGSSATGMGAFSPAGVWGSSQPPYGFLSATGNPSNYVTSGIHGQSNQGIGMRNYSPQGYRGSSNRPESPTSADIVPSSPYEGSGSSSYAGGMPMSTSGAGQAVTASSGMSSSYGSAYAHSQASTQTQSSQDPYSPLPPPTPSYQYGPYGTSQLSPTTPTTSSMMSRSYHSGPYAPPSLLPIQPTPSNYPRPAFPLPGMSGPTYSSSAMGHPGMLQHHHYPGVHHSQQDRPFKCDQCPQSFSRNHDLKRHQRIHLAVKPFPCDNCDKSFSRKDALKRHRLVKGCGKADKANAASTSPTQASANRNSPTTELRRQSSNSTPPRPA